MTPPRRHGRTGALPAGWFDAGVERVVVGSGAEWEPVVGYSRAVRVGPWVSVAGTTAALPGGGVVGGDDVAEQTREALRRIAAALAEVGASLGDVVRTRVFVTDISRWEEAGRAHGEVFGAIRPASSMVEVSALIAPGLLVEVEADAVVGSAASETAGTPVIDPSAWVAPSAVVVGDVRLGPGVRVMHGAVVNGELGPVVLGEDVVVLENAVLKGRAEYPLRVGDAVLVGPHAHLSGATVGEETFIATGASAFAGAVIGPRSELRIGCVVHVNTVLAAEAVVPIGWVAAGDPALLFSPGQHEELWAVQRELGFPQTMYGVPRGTSMRELMRRQSEALLPR